MWQSGWDASFFTVCGRICLEVAFGPNIYFITCLWYLPGDERSLESWASYALEHVDELDSEYFRRRRVVDDTRVALVFELVGDLDGLWETICRFLTTWAGQCDCLLWTLIGSDRAERLF